MSQLNSLDPNAGSADELAAIEANKGNKGPQAPDIVDVGYAYGAQGVAAGDYQAVSRHLCQQASCDHPGHSHC